MKEEGTRLNSYEIENSIIPSSCRLCPRACGADRRSGERGVCGVGGELIVSRAALHRWEEPCVSGSRGSGAVFFGGCPLGCVYCQNREIVPGRVGKAISVERLSRIFLELEAQGAHNINFVTPTHYTPQILRAVEMAREEGMRLPIVYNCGGYERVETLQMLEGTVDVYLTDFKYMEPELAARFSRAPDYPVTAKGALAEMVRQTGPPVFDDEGMLLHGVIVRHLLLPGHLRNAKAVTKYIYESYGNCVYLSLMNQYTPMGEFPEYPELSRRVTRREYERLVDYALDLGVENAFIQVGKTAGESFVPAFDGEGVGQ